MFDLPPPENSTPGSISGVSAQTMSARYQKTSTVIPQHELIIAGIFACPFMAAMFEGRYDEMPKLYPEFRKLLSANCNSIAIAAHDAHIALLHIQDEIAYFIEIASEAVGKILNRALNMVRDIIKHVKLRIKYPVHTTPTQLSETDIISIKALASSGKLTKKQVIALGYAVYETAYINSGINRTEFIVDLGKCFNMKITESYARTAITDIRNDFKDGVPSYFSIFGERLAAKMEKLNDESDEAYDRKVRESRLANKK